MIAIDWGTSSFRAYRLAEDGGVQDKRTAPLGILSVKDGRFAEVLEGQVGDWLASDETPVVMSGMIGSRQGWKEAPYVHCPAGPEEIAARMVEVRWGNGRRGWIAPGLTCRDATGVPDVMRGEEVQIVGVLDRVSTDRPTWVCLPGTHSKWAQLAGARVLAFDTFMTGELFSVMKAHSILGRMMTDAAIDLEAFEAGVRRAREAGGLLHHLFGVRTRGLFGELADDASAAYLSGLLIGHEIASVPEVAGPVHILGAQELAKLYSAALRCFGVEAALLDPDAVVPGLYRLSRSLRNP